MKPKTAKKHRSPAEEKAPMSKTVVERRMDELRVAFERSAQELDQDIRNHEMTVATRRAELTKMQGEYQALERLLNDFTW